MDIREHGLILVMYTSCGWKADELTACVGLDGCVPGV